MRRGDILNIGGEYYAVTRVQADSKRGQIDLISIEEAKNRWEDLDDLLDGFETFLEGKEMK